MISRRGRRNFAMKLLLLLCVVAGARAAPAEPQPLGVDYHSTVGIALTERLRAAEESVDFDGARITGGTLAALGQYPFMGGLLILLQNGRQSSCGSSLISNTRAITAAHCWTDGRLSARQVTVVLGSTTLFHGGNRVVSSRVDVHPQYNHRNLNNDIAVIHLPWVSYTTHINRINLPTGSSSYAGVQANAIGFGATTTTGGASPNLRHVRLPIITNQECLRSHPAAFVIASNICTSGAGGRSICFGDSGGPLQAPGNVLVGVTSYVHHTGCTSGHPAGFARVTSFAAWIRQRM